MNYKVKQKYRNCLISTSVRHNKISVSVRLPFKNGTVPIGIFRTSSEAIAAAKTWIDDSFYNVTSSEYP